jgi:hypothetical protein
VVTTGVIGKLAQASNNSATQAGMTKALAASSAVTREIAKGTSAPRQLRRLDAERSCGGYAHEQQPGGVSPAPRDFNEQSHHEG